MNLKKLIATVLLLPFLANGCATLPKREIELDIASELRNKVLEITELKDPGPMPEIIILKEDSYKKSPEDCSEYDNKEDKNQCQEYNKTLNNPVLGRADVWNNWIQLYTKTINKSFLWLQYNHNTWLNEDLRKIHFYTILSHEMLHHALYRKGVNENLKEYQDTLEHHRLMRDKKYLESAILYLCQKFNLDPKLALNKLKLDDLEYSIKIDNLTKERRTREKSVEKK